MNAVPWTATCGGRRVPLIDVQPEHIEWDDIIIPLSTMNRYLSHVTWTVAEHSLAVCHMLEKFGESHAMQLAGLLHDAHEAYLGDISRPVKLLLKHHTEECILFAAEVGFDRAIFTKAGLMYPLPICWRARIKEFDDAVGCWERRDFMPIALDGPCPKWVPKYHISDVVKGDPYVAFDEKLYFLMDKVKTHNMSY